MWYILILVQKLYEIFCFLSGQEVSLYFKSTTFIYENFYMKQLKPHWFKSIFKFLLLCFL